jgi:hypothetical protein
MGNRSEIQPYEFAGWGIFLGCGWEAVGDNRSESGHKLHRGQMKGRLHRQSCGRMLSNNNAIW